MNEGDLLGTWLEAFIQMFPRVIFPLNSWRLSTTSVSPHFLVYVASLPYPPPGLFHLHLNVYCGPSTKSSASKEGGKAQRSKESHVSVLLCVPASLLQMNVCMCVSFPSTKVLKVLCKTAPNWTHGKTQKKECDLCSEGIHLGTSGTKYQPFIDPCTHHLACDHTNTSEVPWVSVSTLTKRSLKEIHWKQLLFFSIWGSKVGIFLQILNTIILKSYIKNYNSLQLASIIYSDNEKSQVPMSVWGSFCYGISHKPDWLWLYSVAEDGP